MTSAGTWTQDWMWGLPLIGLTIMIHAAGLAFIGDILRRIFGDLLGRDRSRLMFSAVTAAAALLLAMLHAIDAMVWAATYLMLNALPTAADAVYFSLGAITTLGSDGPPLEKHWKLMAALEAMDGMLLFGLSTAFLFSVLETTLTLQSRRMKQRP
jgi:hypothetical protein